MIIRDYQFEKFSDQNFEPFIRKTIIFLKTNFSELAETKYDNELRKYIIMIIAFRKNFQVYSELNI
jgi:hypothetical protein